MIDDLHFGWRDTGQWGQPGRASRLMRHIKFIISLIIFEDHMTVLKYLANTRANAAIL